MSVVRSQEGWRSTGSTAAATCCTSSNMLVHEGSRCASGSLNHMRAPDVPELTNSCKLVAVVVMSKTYLSMPLVISETGA